MVENIQLPHNFPLQEIAVQPQSQWKRNNNSKYMCLESTKRHSKPANTPVPASGQVTSVGGACRENERTSVRHEAPEFFRLDIQQICFFANVF